MTKKKQEETKVEKTKSPVEQLTDVIQRMNELEVENRDLKETLREIEPLRPFLNLQEKAAKVNELRRWTKDVNISDDLQFTFGLTRYGSLDIEVKLRKKVGRHFYGNRDEAGGVGEFSCHEIKETFSNLGFIEVLVDTLLEARGKMAEFRKLELEVEPLQSMIRSVQCLIEPRGEE